MNTNSKHLAQHFATLAVDPSTRLGRLLGTGPRQPEPEGEGDPAPEGGAEEKPISQQDAAHQRLLGDLAKQKKLVRELSGQLSQFKKAEDDAAAAQERAAGDFKAIETRLLTQIRSQQEQLDAANAAIDGFHKAERRSRVLDGLLPVAGVSNRKLVERLLDDIGLADADPDALTEGDYKKATKALRKEAPELFATPSNNPKPAPSEGTKPADSSSGDYWKQRAAQSSQRALGGAYAAATGRTPSS